MKIIGFLAKDHIVKYDFEIICMKYYTVRINIMMKNVNFLFL